VPGKAPDKKPQSVEALIQWLRLFRLGDVWQGGRFAGSEPPRTGDLHARTERGIATMPPPM